MNTLAKKTTLLLFLIFGVLYAEAQVKAFSLAKYQGEQETLKNGKYTYMQLQKRGLANLGSLRIPKGCNVKVYPNANWQGDSKKFGKNSPALSSISNEYSLKVNCGSVGSQPGFAIGVSDEVGRVGDLITVDVNVSDFEQVVSMQYSMNWDPKVLKFEKVKGFNLKDLSAENFGSKQATKGSLLMAWYDQSVQGVRLPDGTIIYQVIFRVVGETDKKSRIKLTSTPIVTEIMRADGTALYFNNVDGSFTLN